MYFFVFFFILFLWMLTQLVFFFILCNPRQNSRLFYSLDVPFGKLQDIIPFLNKGMIGHKLGNSKIR